LLCRFALVAAVTTVLAGIRATHGFTAGAAFSANSGARRTAGTRTHVLAGRSSPGTGPAGVAATTAGALSRGESN
jgi:hypothetical protein